MSAVSASAECCSLRIVFVRNPSWLGGYCVNACWSMEGTSVDAIRLAYAAFHRS